MFVQGRPYADKMQWDRTEMLYWLQEERKQQALQFEVAAQTTARYLPSLAGTVLGAPLPMALQVPQIDTSAAIASSVT